MRIYKAIITAIMFFLVLFVGTYKAGGEIISSLPNPFIIAHGGFEDGYYDFLLNEEEQTPVPNVVVIRSKYGGLSPQIQDAAKKLNEKGVLLAKHVMRTLYPVTKAWQASCVTAPAAADYQQKVSDCAYLNAQYWASKLADDLGGELPGGFKALAIDEIPLGSDYPGYPDVEFDVKIAVETLKVARTHPDFKDFFKDKFIFVWAGGEPKAGVVKTMLTYADRILIERYLKEGASVKVFSDDINKIIQVCETEIKGPLCDKIYEKSIITVGVASTEDEAEDNNPGVDFSEYLDEELHYIKNDAVLNKLSGIGFYTFNRARAETITWVNKLARHYYVNNQSSYYSGDDYNLSYIKNPSFEDADTNWTLQIGSGGEVSSKNIADIDPKLIDEYWTTRRRIPHGTVVVDKVQNKLINVYNVLYMKRGSSRNTVLQEITFPKGFYHLDVYAKKFSSDYEEANVDVEVKGPNGSNLVTYKEKRKINIKNVFVDTSEPKYYLWTRVRIEFKVPEDNFHVKIMLSDAAAGTGEITLWDFVELEKIKSGSLAAGLVSLNVKQESLNNFVSLLKNRSFEDGVLFWEGAGEVKGKPLESGKRALLEQSNAWYSSLSQDIFLQETFGYKISGWVYLDNIKEGDSASIHIRAYTGSGECRDFAVQANSNKQGEWQYVESAVKFDWSYQNNAKLILSAYRPQTNSDSAAPMAAYFDDINVEVLGGDYTGAVLKAASCPPEKEEPPPVTEPVVQEPAVQEPVVQEPVVQEPAVQEPEIQTSLVGQSVPSEVQAPPKVEVLPEPEVPAAPEEAPAGKGSGGGCSLIPDKSKSVSSEQKEVYKDGETGSEVWKMTDNTAVNYQIKKLEGECGLAKGGYSAIKCDNIISFNRALYYANPSFSPDGRYVVYFGTYYDPQSLTDLAYAHIRIINADGSGDAVFGDWNNSSWNKLESKQNICLADGSKWTSDAKAFMRSKAGWWSRDSRYYYAGGGMYAIDMQNNRNVSQLSGLQNSDGGLCFKDSILSPDGLRIAAVDTAAGQYKLQFINAVSGALEASIPLSDWGSATHGHGWLGPDYIYVNSVGNIYCKDINPLSYGSMWPVYKKDGTFTNKYLTPDPHSDPNNPPDNFDCSDGVFPHIAVNQDAYALGTSGMIGGDGRPFAVADSNFSAQTRTIWPLDKSFGKPIGTHSNFSPDGKWLVVENAENYPGMLTLYPVKSNTGAVPIQLARHRTLKSYCLTGDTSEYCEESKKYTWRCAKPSGRYSSDDMTLQEFKELEALKQKGNLTAEEKTKQDLLIKKRSGYYNSCIGDYPWPAWSPDGTKIIYWSFDAEFLSAEDGVKRDENVENVYAAVVSKPVAPVMVDAASTETGNLEIKWKPAKNHKEIKEYELLGSTKGSEGKQIIGTIPETHFFIKEENKGYISENETTIIVDGINNGYQLPAAPIYMELEAISPSKRIEIVKCNAVKPGEQAGTAIFSECERGSESSAKGRHWNNSFVWIYPTAYYGYTIEKDAVKSYDYLGIRSVEWSGLKSELSDYIKIAVQEPAGQKPGDQEQVAQEPTVTESAVQEPVVQGPLVGQSTAVGAVPQSEVQALPKVEVLPESEIPVTPEEALAAEKGGGGCSLIKGFI